MLLADAKRVLEENGIEAEETKTMEGSCRVDGLCIGSGTVRPTIYQHIIEDMDEEEFIRFAKKQLGELPDFDLGMLQDRDFILDHAVSCIRHETDDETAVKWKVYGDLEEFVRIRLGDDENGNMMSTVVTERLLEMSDIDREELRSMARKNLAKSAKIKGMSELLREMLGADNFPGLDLPEEDEMMYVATNESKVNGASVMLLDDLLNVFCEAHGIKSVKIIPSSIHEVILLDSERAEADQIDQMIREVNESQVDEIDRLSDHVYEYTVA